MTRSFRSQLLQIAVVTIIPVLALAMLATLTLSPATDPAHAASSNALSLPYNDAPKTSQLYWCPPAPQSCSTSGHPAIDFAIPDGTPIFAAFDGTVSDLKDPPLYPDQFNYDWGWANYIRISHPTLGITTAYAHLSSIEVTRGQTVVRGERIGLSGQSGRAYGAHLHFQVEVPGGTVNPGDPNDSVNCGMWGAPCPARYYPPTPSCAQPFADGCLLRNPAGSVFVIYGRAKFGIPSMDVFNALGLQWANVQNVSDAVIASVPTAPEDGALLQELGVGSVYVTYGGAKFGVPSAALFNQLGLNWNAIRTVPQGGLAQIPAVPVDGTLLQELGVGSVYVTYGGAKFGVPSAALFNQLGLNWNAIRTVPQGGLAQIPTVPVDGTLLKEYSSPAQYVFYGGARFSIPDPATLLALGLGSTPLRVVPDGEVVALSAVPVDGTLLQPLSDPATYIVCRGTKKTVASLGQFGFLRSAVRAIPPGSLNALASSDPALGNNACNDDDDGDGYTDAREIALGKDPLKYCPIMRADVDGDGVVSILDFVRVAQYFAQTIPPAPARYDQDGDNKISVLDFVKMAQVFIKHVTACP